MVHGKIKTYPSDFFVAEILVPQFSEPDGEHLWCYVEKSGMNTHFVKRRWSELTDCPLKDISHSGLKDRHAVTRQWLCLPAKYASELPNQEQKQYEYWKILEQHRQRKKLRIGTHRQNRFTIVIREIVGYATEIEKLLEQVREQGFPNAFGSQRFGHDNLSHAMKWVEKKRLPKKSDERGRVISALRSAAFNAQLEMRMLEQNWRIPLEGDCMVLNGSNSHFFIEQVDEELRERVRCGDISPAGWLPGKGEYLAVGVAAQFRQKTLSSYEEVIEYLEQYVETAWRAFCVIPQSMEWQWLEEATLAVSFILPRGSYATALLAELMEITDVSNAQYSSH